ncbi:MAG TPA: GNAT family N-acetyltransferase [Acidimicrobiales bacterium]|nr:GNAT family N-acetyltransferase [Acidimicrobiales bacterium]
MAPHWKVEPLDLDHADDVTKTAYLRIAQHSHNEAIPADGPIPDDELWFQVQNIGAAHPKHYWCVWDENRTELVGVMCVSWEDYEDNRELSWIELDVTPPYRRQKAGAALLQVGFEFVKEQGRPLVGFDANNHVPAGWEFLKAIGADHKYTGRFSMLKFAEVDRPMLEGWVARSAERAQDYELLRWDGPCPDEYADPFVAEQNVMNTAPTENLEYEDEVFTVGRLRDREAMHAHRNIEQIVRVARHKPTGEFVGHSDVWLPQRWPTKAYQNDTGVNPAHREKGLGRWLKAQMLLDLMNERPQLDNISTWNAGSNDAMLGINYAMGFKTVTEFGEHQVRADAALDKLATILR